MVGSMYLNDLEFPVRNLQRPLQAAITEKSALPSTYQEGIHHNNLRGGNTANRLTPAQPLLCLIYLLVKMPHKSGLVM